jgi:hypothetical protein
LFRLLSEAHVPFAVSDNVDILKTRKFDVVVTGDWAPKELEQYAENGGRVMIVSHAIPEFPVTTVVSRSNDVKGYLRVRSHQALPSLANTDLVMTNGPFTELESNGNNAPLTLIPPSMIGPPELVHVDMTDTNKPGLVFVPKGKGRVAWIPWDLAALYYRESLPAHAGIFRDVLRTLNPEWQIETDAHPLVEITWMKQNGKNILHLINLSGHSETGYFPPIAMTNIHLKIEGSFGEARALRSASDLKIKKMGGYSELTLPQLSDYEAIVLK